jgi:hypothetical protein
MQVTFSHLADHALVSADGKVSVIGIFEGIVAPSLPYQHGQWFLVFGLEGRYTDANRPHPVRIQCVDADGVEVFRAECTLAFGTKEGKPAKPGNDIKHTQALPLPPGIPFQKHGRYDINFFIDDRVVHTHTLTVAPPRVAKAA